MSARLLRVILVSVMFMTLFLPWSPLSHGFLPTWMYMLWVSNEAIAVAIFHGIRGVYFLNVLRFCMVLSPLTVPLLILLNACLAVRSFRGLRMLYRFLLLALLPLTWYRTFLTDPAWRGVGFWANAAVVSAAVLIEIVLIGTRLRKSGNADS
jgi:hypothetical protein